MVGMAYYKADYHNVFFLGSCADVMHSARPFQNGFGEPVISLVLRDVLKGLCYLHTLGCIHRYSVPIIFICDTMTTEV